MEVKQQLALRPISTYKRGGGGGLDGMAVSARERSSLTSASFRVYYSLRADAGAVPFLWESVPGTPKRGAADVLPESPHPTISGTAGGATMLLPPLSPPPSFRSSSQLKRRRPSWTATAGGIVRALLRVLWTRKSRGRSRRHSLVL